MLLLTFLFNILVFGATPVFASDLLEFDVLDVGQGQSILVRSDGQDMLIDGGGRSTSSFVVSYLKQKGIESLDLVVLSHYEEDHMSGLIGVLESFPCDTLLLPSYAGTGALYESFAVSALSNGCKIIHPEPGFEYPLGNSIVRVIGPLRNDYTTENDMSLCIKLKYGDSSFIICGDAQTESETDLAGSSEDISADVYVANHHGSSTSSTDTFLDRVSPEYVVISCGKDNGFGHPSMETLLRLQSRNVTMFRTDLQGGITAYSDGTQVWFDTEPCTDWSTGDGLLDLSGMEGENKENNLTRSSPNGMGTDSLVSGDISEQHEYVCNTHTKKFHYPVCSSVSQIKDSNRLNTYLSREELIAEGYEPCGNCNP